MNKIQKQKGITLIALVITIVVLIILAGVAINLTIGENGIFTRAKNARQQSDEETVREKIETAIVELQVEEVSQTGRLSLKNLYENLESKDSNITLNEYSDGDTVLTGTYTINGKTYSIVINEKFKVEVGDEAEVEEKPVQVGELVWNADGTVSIELSTELTGNIEYQVNATAEDGWQTGTLLTGLQVGDKLYVRVNDGTTITKPQEIEIKDTIKPEEFTITVSEDDITHNSIKIISTGTQDKQTGIRDYSFVVTKNGEVVQEITEQDVTEYLIENLSPETKYVVYMLAYDNAENVRKSNEVTVTTPEYVLPQIGNVLETLRSGNNLDEGLYNYSWDEIESLAKAISDDNRNTITYTTTQVTITMNGKEYTLGVGDYKNLTYEEGTKQVRILGFNHDTLADKTVYGGTENTYAGISFEFVDFMMAKQMNSTDTSAGGWASCALRNNTLKSTTTLNNINIGSKIKEVTKIYNKGNTGTENGTCTDKLWLLACSEIWQNGIKSGYYGRCKTKEGEQYAFYSMNNKLYNDASQTATRKPTGSSKSYWWLRSPSYGNYSSNNKFCLVNLDGSCYDEYAADSRWGVAPGFTI